MNQCNKCDIIKDGSICYRLELCLKENEDEKKRVPQEIKVSKDIIK
jgi:hypothetical protein